MEGGDEGAGASEKRTSTEAKRTPQKPGPEILNGIERKSPGYAQKLYSVFLITEHPRNREIECNSNQRG